MKAPSTLADTEMGWGWPPSSTGQRLALTVKEEALDLLLLSLGCKESAKATENIDGVHFQPHGKGIEGTKRAPNGQRANCCIENTNDSALCENFYFCLLASVLWFQSYSLTHSEICLCMQGQLCHSCFQMLSWKVYIKLAEYSYTLGFCSWSFSGMAEKRGLFNDENCLHWDHSCPIESNIIAMKPSQDWISFETS